MLRLLRIHGKNGSFLTGTVAWDNHGHVGKGAQLAKPVEPADHRMKLSEFRHVIHNLVKARVCTAGNQDKTLTRACAKGNLLLAPTQSGRDEVIRIKGHGLRDLHDLGGM